MASSFGAPEIAHVQLGEIIYDVCPQPLPYLEDQLGDLFGDLTSGGINIDQEKGLAGLLGALSGGAHTLLSIFIDDLMPRHKWEGYRTEQERADGVPRDPEHVRAVSPTGPQVKLAIAECFRVNGLDMWDTLKQLVDPTMLQDLGSELVANVRREMRASTEGKLADLLLSLYPGLTPFDIYDDVRPRTLADRGTRGFGLTIPRIAELLEAAKARQDDATKATAVAHGLAMSGKKGASKLAKLFPGRRRRGAGEAVEAEEHPPGLEGELPADRPGFAEGENDDWMDAATANFEPAD